MRRVVVTGMGAVTPIGIGIENFWNGIKENKTGFDEITKFDTTGFKASLAAEIRDFDAKQFIDPKSAKRMELFCQYAVTAAKEALEASGLDMERKIRTASAVMWAPALEACRQWNVNTKDCWSAARPESIRFWFR